MRREGTLYVTKECSNYTGQAGSYCTFTSSNIPEIQVGSRIFYTQAFAAAPEGTNIAVDTNVVLYVGTGD